MLKKILLLLLLASSVVSSKAQATDSLLVNKLGDFDLARFNSDELGALRIGESILPDTAKLSEKIRISFFDHLARLYESDGQEDKALFYFEKVAAAVPDYYVAQRALGYLYDDNAEEMHLKLYQAKSDEAGYKTLLDNYKKGVLKALPHLEKAQACDPDDETLDLIRTLYQNIHDEQGLSSLNERLKGLAKNCIDILDNN